MEGQGSVHGGCTGLASDEWVAMRRSLSGMLAVEPVMAVLSIGGKAVTDSRAPAAGRLGDKQQVSAKSNAGDAAETVCGNVTTDSFIAFKRELLPEMAMHGARPASDRRRGGCWCLS